MSKFFRTTYSTSLLQFWLLFLRIGAAGAMLTHGYPKFQALLAGPPYKFGDPIGLGVTFSFILIVFAEFLCSILLAVGLVGRFAAAMLSIGMAVAAFIAHAGDPFARKEMAILYLLIFLTLTITGPGRYSLDAALGRK